MVTGEHVLRVSFGVILLAVSGVISLGAQEVSARAYLSNRSVGLNQQFVLNVEVSGAQGIDAYPELPDMSEFSAYLGSSTATSMQVVNGRTTLSVTLQYRFQATKEGTYQIGPMEVQAGGKRMRTEPVTITVSATAAPRGGGAPADDAVVDPEDLFLTTEVNTRRVYENQPVVVEYRIYTRVNVEAYSVTSLPSTAGFWAEEFPRPQSLEAERVVRDGQQYATAVLRKVALFSTGPGTKTIEPMSIEAQVRVRRQSRDLFDDFFGRLDRGSLFGTSVPVMATSKPITIEVDPLPESGRPRDFTGFVGDLKLSASLDAPAAKTNEALTYRLRIEGQGNLRILPEPSVRFPEDFEVYPPSVSEQIERDARGVRGTRSIEYVLIPRMPGTRTIPPVRMSYFDPARRAYATATTDPMSVEVSGPALEGPIAAARTRGRVDALRRDIRFIRIMTPRFRPAGRTVLDSPGFWLLMVTPLFGVVGAWSVRRHRDRLAGDVAYARHRRAGRLARKRLARARSLVSAESQRQFYAEVGRSLEGFLGDKLNLAEAGFIREDVRAQLQARGVSDEVVDEYMACLDVCDRQRFAPSEPNVADMRAFLDRAGHGMTELNRQLAR